jgi:hypothetical protein
MKHEYILGKNLLLTSGPPSDKTGRTAVSAWFPTHALV